MQVEPASIDQIHQTDDGGWMIIPAEAGTVAGELRKIDAGLKVRFSKSGECWCVYHEHHPDCPHNGPGGPDSTYLVLTAKAQQGRSGIWTGLDDRVVKRILEINPFGRSGYDFAAALERNRKEREREQQRRFADRIGETGEKVAHAIRKSESLGPYRGRIFKPREVGK